MKISILMCVKNSMPYIMASVNSFLKQDYKNKELIIIYSDSIDSSEDYIRSIKSNKIKKFKFNGSIYESLNFGINKSKGSLVGILHSDDILFSKSTLSLIAKEYNRVKSDVIFGNIAYCKKNNILNIVRLWDKIKISKKHEIPPHTGTFIKKNILKKNKYKKNYIISGDTELLFRIFNKNIRYSYVNKFVTIMRVGGLSTNLFFLFKKIFEDLKIFKLYNLSILDYIQKVLFKLRQVFGQKIVRLSNYHKELNSASKVKFLKPRDINNVSGKIISALNLAFISYNYKLNLITQNYLFWPDGIFSRQVGIVKKIPGRLYFKEIINELNFKKKNKRKIFIIGNLPKKSKSWINKNLSAPYKHKKLSYGDINDLKKEVLKIKFSNYAFIILTLPTPKQEIIANIIIAKYPEVNVLCIGGSINILSGHEEKAPSFFYNLNLEWLWRLRFDTKRRIFRLFESGILYLKLTILGDNKIH